MTYSIQESCHIGKYKIYKPVGFNSRWVVFVDGFFLGYANSITTKFLETSKYLRITINYKDIETGDRVADTLFDMEDPKVLRIGKFEEYIISKNITVVSSIVDDGYRIVVCFMVEK